MRRDLSALLLVLTAVFGHANSYLFTLKQKVAACKAILRVSVTEAALKPNDSRGLAVCKAKVLEVLKGEPRKEVTFRFHALGEYSQPEKLSEMVKKEYIVFLHELGPPYQEQKEFWVFEGPAGIRPVAVDYQEYRISADMNITTETLSHSNFVAAIQSFAALPVEKSK